MSLIVQNSQIIGVTGQNMYPSMQPFTHESGACWYTCNNSDGLYEVEQITDLHKRTIAELQATPEYQLWLDEHPEAYPAVYCVIQTFERTQAPDGKAVPKLKLADGDTLTVSGVICSDSTNPETTVLSMVTYTYAITLCRIRSPQYAQKHHTEPVPGSLPVEVQLTEGTFSLTYAPAERGSYMISDEDFDILKPEDIAGLPEPYRVVLDGGNRYFKVI